MSASFIGSVYVTFTNGDSIVTYTATDPSQPLSVTFDGQNDQMYDPATGNVWLELYTVDANKGESAVVLHDYISNAFIMIYQQRSTRNNWFSVMVCYFNETYLYPLLLTA